MKFPTAAVLGATTGVLLGDYHQLLNLASHLLGVDADPPHLRLTGPDGAIGKAILAAHPELPSEVEGDWREWLPAQERRFGRTFDLSDALRECLARA